MCENIISKLLYAGTYQDNGLTIFNGQRTVAQTVCWLYNFQLQVDEVAEGDFFQFTVEVWKPCTANNLPTAEEEEEAIGGISPEEWEVEKQHIQVEIDEFKKIIETIDSETRDE